MEEEDESEPVLLRLQCLGTHGDTCRHVHTHAHTCRSHLVSSLNMVLRVQGPHFEDCWGQGS